MIGKIINMHKIRYSRLDELFSQIDSNISLTEKRFKDVVDIHIDLHGVLEALYTSSNYAETNWQDVSNVDLVASIVNLTAHYRQYFFNKKYFTRIFVYFGNQKPRNNSEYSILYGYKYFDKYSKDNEDYKPVNQTVRDALKLVKPILTYVPYIHYIPTKNIEPMIACAYNITRSSGHRHVVLSKDLNWYQLLSFKNTAILRAKKIRNRETDETIDDSFLLTRETLYPTLLKNTSYEVQHIPVEMLSILYSFAGLKSRDIKGLAGYGYAKIAKVLDLAINRGLIQAKYTNIKNVLDEIYSGKNEAELISFFRAIDMQFQLNCLTSSQKKIIKDSIVDRYNKRDLKALNTVMFTGDNTLMLDEIFRGIPEM